MGWTGKESMSYATKLGTTPTMAKYKNETTGTQLIKSFSMWLGVPGDDVVYDWDGNKITGTGNYIDFYVSIGSTTSTHVTVNNAVGASGSAYTGESGTGRYPKDSDLKEYTVYFNPGVTVDAGVTVNVMGTYNNTMTAWEDYIVTRKRKEGVSEYVSGEVVDATYTITYDANGGSGAPGPQTKTHGQTLTLSPIKPTKSSTTVSQYTVTYNKNYSGSTNGSATATKTRSYSFSKWTTEQKGGGTTYYPGGPYTANAPATLYAQYSSSDSGGSVELRSYTRSGYTFAGWYTAASGGTKVGNSGATYTPISDVTLYAHWTANEYTVTFNANGGSGGPTTQTKTHGVNLTLTSSKPTKAYTITYNANGGSVSPSSKAVSCTFDCWNTKSNGTGTNYASGGTYTANATATLYAQWTNNKAGALATPTRDNHKFIGWFTEVQDGIQVTADTIIDSDITLYAIWEAEKCPIWVYTEDGWTHFSGTALRYNGTGWNKLEEQ